MTINFDKQYIVTVVREKIKQAMTSWSDLETYIGALTNSLYNGAYIDEYKATKALVSNAYRENAVQIQTITAPTTKELAQEFIIKAREIFLNMQAPSPNYNAWRKVGGYGRDIITFTDPEDMVFLLRNDIRAYVDVTVLAEAFNMSKTDFLSRVITVDSFDIYGDDNTTKLYDGSHIYGIMCDRRWFRIKTQDMYMEDFRNANNRSMQYYLNLIKMMQYSLFANAVVFADEVPSIPVTSLQFQNETLDIVAGNSQIVTIMPTPSNATTPEITYKSSSETVATVTSGVNNTITINALSAGTTTITATAGNVTTTMTVTVTADTETQSSTKSTKTSTK